MSKTSTASCLPDSPETLSPSPSAHPENWSSLLKPLSAFPTPPDSIGADSWGLDSDSCSSTTGRTPAIPHSTWQTPTITASTSFLTSLLPPSCKAAAIPKSDSILPGILHRGQHLFTPYTIAMAGCILDALSSKFCHALLQHSVIPRIRHAPASGIHAPTRTHSVTAPGSFGELIVATALLIATKFLNDRPPHNIHFATQVFDGAFSTDAVTVAERVVLSDVNYRLGYLCAEGVVGEKMGRLERGIADEKRRMAEGAGDPEGLEGLEFELGFDIDLDAEVGYSCDDVVDESRMLAVFEMDEDFEFDDDDD